MKKFKHVSFDIWLTLIRSNPKFKEERNLLIFEKYNSKQLSLQDVVKIVRQIDVQGNKKSEVTGIHVDSRLLLHDILVQLNDNVTLEQITELDYSIQKLFLEYMPVLYNDQTKSVLKKLVENGFTLSILSNTGFIHGKTLIEMFNNFDIFNLFEFMLFSDVIGISKPNINSFDLILKEIAIRDILNPGEDVLHVGDNPIADGGSEASGITFFQINTNSKTIRDVENLLLT